MIMRWINIVSPKEDVYSKQDGHIMPQNISLYILSYIGTTRYIYIPNNILIIYW